MKDHVYHDADGSATPISQMSDEKIHEVLRDGIEIADSTNCTADGVRERLLIELLIREKGMRNGL